MRLAFLKGLPKREHDLSKDFESGRKSFKFGVESSFGNQLTGFVSKLELRIKKFWTLSFGKAASLILNDGKFCC